MRDFLLVIGSTILFFVVFISIIIGIQKEIFRLPVYYNPNGLVLNVNSEYKEFWGQSLSLEDLNFAKDLHSKFSFAEHEVRIYDRSENVQIGRFFFIHLDKMKIIEFFYSDILMSLISFVVGIWFFYYIRDLFIFLFFMGISSLVLANFFFLAFEGFHFFLIFSLFYTGFTLFNLSFRFRGKELQTKWLIPQLIFSGIVGFIAETEYDNAKVLVNLGQIGLLLVSFSVITAAFSLIYDIFRYDQQSFMLKRKLSLLVSLFVIFLVPFSIISSDPLHFLEMRRSFFLVIFILFLISFVFGTYRYSLVPVQIFFNPTIINIILISFVVGIYIAVSFGLNYYFGNPYLINPGYLNFLFLFVTVIYLIQAKSQIRLLVDYYSFKKNEEISQSLEVINHLISSPISMKMVVGTMNRNMIETLKVNKIVLLIPGDQFPNVDFRNVNITRISKNSDIWKYFKESQEITVTSHLAYGVGFRENLHNYLTGMGVQIAYPIRDLQSKGQNKAILLIGEKISKQNFSLGELRYIREVGRLASMLIDNYNLLADEIEKKKIMRKLHTASVLDHTLNLIDHIDFPELNIGYISIPAVEISGDYLDIIQLNQSKVAFFLGDVSGHGLGTGYIVTAIKAMVRDMIHSDFSLIQIFECINLFLKEKYDGNEFMTLIGGILDTKKGEFQYINAGHPGPIVITDTGKLNQFNKSQRVLGILNTNYNLQEIPIVNNQKLILYSDGVTETFGESDRMFGEDALLNFLKIHDELSADKIPIQLKQYLDNFRSGMDMTDDTTFVAIELVNPSSFADNQ